MKRKLVALMDAFLLALGMSANAEPLESRNREENIIWLSGPYLDQLDPVIRKFWPDNAMVCGMKFRYSTLSVRAAPDAASAELAVAPYYAVMVLTGQFTTDKSWARVAAFSINFTTDGQRLDEARHTYAPVDGWVNTDYLCSFVDM